MKSDSWNPCAARVFSVFRRQITYRTHVRRRRFACEMQLPFLPSASVSKMPFETLSGALQTECATVMFN